MNRFAQLALAVALVAGACGGSDDSVVTETTSAGLATPVEDLASLDSAAASALRQVELGGLRRDLGYEVADALLNASNTCAAVVFLVDIGAGQKIASTAYMVRTAGRSAADIFPRAVAMGAAYLEEWDAVVGEDEWGLLALAPPETDVDDVSTVCSGPFLDEALRRYVAVQIEPE